jgi:putative spermidine/putrescine transport system permease protein
MTRATDIAMEPQIGPTGGADEREAPPQSGRARGYDAWLWAALPAIAILLLVFVLPMLYLASNSLHRSAGLGQVAAGLTLDNYARFIGDPFYLGILLQTFWLGLVVVTICAVLGYPVAYLLARTQSRRRGLLIFLVVAPLLISVVIRNLGWFPVLGNSGLVNWALQGVGLIDQPLRLANNFTGVVIGLVHTLLPFMILLLTTVIQKIDPSLEEAALNLGASPTRTFCKVVLPLSRPGLLAGYLLVFTMSISAYTTPAMLGGRRVLVMATYIAQQIASVLDYAFGSAAAVILVAAACTLAALSLRSGREE